MYASTPAPVPVAAAPTTSLYYTFEKIMEAKAKKLGLRREFFQLLQKKRDLVRR
jgi:hypothetical protein